MTSKELSQRAFDECCSPHTAVKHGIQGVFPFWNAESTQFMYAPSFHFTGIRMIRKYRYDVTDEKGGRHSFLSDHCYANLCPVWGEIPEGVATLTVTALKDNGEDYAIIGARTFMRLSPFTTDIPAAKCSYREAAKKAYKYVLDLPMVNYWLEKGEPDPSYDLNIYPSKMIGALIPAMVNCAKMFPEEEERAIRIARNAADYLIGISRNENEEMAGIPPTYNLDFCPDPDEYGINTPNWNAAKKHLGEVMMGYPAEVAMAYIALYDATGDEKYFIEAKKIGLFYLSAQGKNGTWHLVYDVKSGKPACTNYLSPILEVTPMLLSLYEKTGDEKWKVAAERSVHYVEKVQLSTYNWEGQFEDTVLTSNYTNLTHYSADCLIRYFAKYFPNDGGKMWVARELMRFVEDQFVIWKRPAPWPFPDGGWDGYPSDTSLWHTPCGLEQYYWHVPIDSSTADIALTFLSMYQATGDEMYLAKAKALADQITCMQHDDGKIPTHWMNTPGAEKNFWLNCMLNACNALTVMEKYQ